MQSVNRRSWSAGSALVLWVVIAQPVLSIRMGRAQDEPDYPTQAAEACVFNFGVVGCENMGKPAGGQQMMAAHFAAVAISPSTLTVGGAHGRNSEDDADGTALQNCRRAGATDCKVAIWGNNSCVSLAESISEKAYGYSISGNRDGAASDAMVRCRGMGGKNCIVVAAPCAGDDIQWTSPLPLPSGGQGGKVDAALVGTWAMLRNPGQWIWRVAANGTYEFHSETDDNTPSNAGMFSGSGGHYTLHAISMQWDDAGTYVVQSPGVIVYTGRLGTGTWKRIGGASTAVANAPAPTRPSGPPITVRK
jgi:hypothetical protein